MPTDFVAESLKEFSEQEKAAEVTLSQGLVTLLSEQLYKSPMKAIEELVVNSFDADATECRLAVSPPSDLVQQKHAFVAVYDNGKGMDVEGLVDLWCIGRSRKRDSDYKKRFQRTQIGKFGIGKLASYAVAHRLTYVTRSASELLAVSMDFRRFSAPDRSSTSAIDLPIVRITNWDGLLSDSRFEAVIDAAKLPSEAFDEETWTLALLEDLKNKSAEIKQGRLRWVLATAMPLRPDFRLFLNGEEIKSSKEEYKKIVEFDVADLPDGRLSTLRKKTSQDWRRENGALASDSFPAGIRGSVIVCERSLKGKSDDLQRSYGFFIRVRGRLINEDDPLFGLDPLSHQTFNCFRADIDVDDLDAYLLSSREEIEAATIERDLKALLEQLFNEARQRRDDHYESIFRKEETKREGERPFIAPRLVEHPVADVLASSPDMKGGTDADENWFYLQVEDQVEISSLLHQLYAGERKPYRYDYENLGQNSRMVKFDVQNAKFTLNCDHEYVKANADDGRSKRVLEDLVTAEALLEVYLREENVPAHVVGEILERRDSLLRGLAKDHAISLAAIAGELRDAAADQYNLEVALVRAARGLGFVAKHISGSGEPDGIARWIDYPQGESKITLEAKSSKGEPSLAQLDFAGLAEHVQSPKYQAQGCLLVAPAYPGSTKGGGSAAATRATENRISCWTIDQLARVVEQAEMRHVTPNDVLNVVLNAFTPDDVSQAVDNLLSEPLGNKQALYRAILHELRELEGKATKSGRSFDMILGRLVDRPNFELVELKNVKDALLEMSGASKGTLQISGESVRVLASLDEIERRLESLLGEAATPRRRGPFRKDSKGAEGGEKKT